MKLTIKSLKPRNPLVVPARRRLAGAHRKPAAAQRQQGRRVLNQELRHAIDNDRSHRPRPSP